jgi:hypothetical protein
MPEATRSIVQPTGLGDHSPAGRKDQSQRSRCVPVNMDGQSDSSVWRTSGGNATILKMYRQGEEVDKGVWCHADFTRTPRSFHGGMGGLNP